MNSKSILVVEDDPWIREALAQVLEIEGYAVLTAHDGEEGLEILKRDGVAQPSLVFLDLMMPVMDGWEFLAMKKKDPSLAKIPVVVLSASGQRVAPPGASAYFEKPFEIDRILEIAKDCLGACA